jgi:hypothetical protein
MKKEKYHLLNLPKKCIPDSAKADAGTNTNKMQAGAVGSTCKKTN